MTRLVQPELLDHLPTNAPEALRSRKELRRINAIMGNHRWMRSAVRDRLNGSTRILELGAGDGLLWREGSIPAAHWTALDLAPRPAGWPRDAPWIQEDILTAERLPDAEIVIANLFLHHFNSEALAAIGEKLPSTCRLLLACEPARRSLHLWQGRALSLLMRHSKVTHHDMLVSIRAGFLGNELPDALGLIGWKWRVSTTLLGAYHLTAWR